MRRLLIWCAVAGIAAAVAYLWSQTTKQDQRATVTAFKRDDGTIERDQVPHSNRSDQHTENGGSVVDEWARESFPASDPPQSW